MMTRYIFVLAATLAVTTNLKQTPTQALNNNKKNKNSIFCFLRLIVTFSNWAIKGYHGNYGYDAQGSLHHTLKENRKGTVVSVQGIISRDQDWEIVIVNLS